MVIMLNGVSDWLVVTTEILFIVCLAYWLFHIAGYWFHKFASWPVPSSSIRHSAAAGAPRVAIIVPIRDEPRLIIQRMFTALAGIKYEDLEVVIVDNSTDPILLDSYRIEPTITASLRVVRKVDTIGFKAGAINSALRTLSDAVSYVLVLDADHAPFPHIVKTLLPFMEDDKKLAFAQAPQRFETRNNDLLTQAYAFQQRVFYDHVCPGMSKLGSLFMTGTNVLIRRTALEDIGGFDESTLTEDIRTSMLLHTRGWLGVHVPEVVAIGLSPPDFESYHRQQRRWAIGTLQNTWQAWKHLHSAPRSLKPFQWLQYLGWCGTWYLQGFFGLFMVWSSLIFCLVGINLRTGIFAIVPCVAFIATAIYQVLDEKKARGTSILNGLLSQAIYFGNSIVYVLATIDFVANRRMTYQVTRKLPGSAEAPSRPFVVYHSVLFATSAFAVGLMLSQRNPAFLVQVPWVLLFMCQSGMIVLLTRPSYMRSHRPLFSYPKGGKV